MFHQKWISRILLQKIFKIIDFKIIDFKIIDFKIIAKASS
jgi:hypothetical protein